jgi:hypothetical protein
MSSNIFHKKIVNSIVSEHETAENNGETGKVNSMWILLGGKWCVANPPSLSNVTQNTISSFLNFHSLTHNY